MFWQFLSISIGRDFERKHETKKESSELLRLLFQLITQNHFLKISGLLYCNKLER